MSDEQTNNEETLERWTAKRRSALVIEILRGDTTAAEAARKHALTVAESGRAMMTAMGDGRCIAIVVKVQVRRCAPICAPFVASINTTWLSMWPLSRP
jgi:hypothetical protein